jgi:acetylornithine deacetylase
MSPPDARSDDEMVERVAAAESVAELTRALVSIPSHEDETLAGDAVEAWLRRHTDAAVHRDDVGNVLARRPPAGAGAEPDRPPAEWAAYGAGDGDDGGDGRDRSLALVGHHDVVPPDESQVDGAEYVVEERDGRLYGRGTADMKGSVAAAMVAFRDAAPAVELVFASFVGEESGGEGAQGAIADGFVPTHAVVGEGSTGYSAPGVTDVVVAHKGRRGSTVVAEGRASHASEPEAGVNAVYRAVDAVELIRALDAPEATVLGRSLSGSVVVTGFHGGDTWNVVPERCEVTVDERTVPGERAGLGVVEDLDGVSWTVDSDLPPMACDDAAFADAVLDAARAAQAGRDGDADAEPQHVSKPHATDAGRLAGAGTACVVCGASEPGEAHTAAESASIAVLERCARVYRGVAEAEW